MSKKSSNPVVSLTSGCIAGAVEAMCVWPLEYVKASDDHFHGTAAIAEKNACLGLVVWLWTHHTQGQYGHHQMLLL